MAKKKEAETVEVADTSLLNPGKAEAPVVTPDVVIAEVDFNELLELEKAARQTEEQLNRVSGNVYRLKKDLDLFHGHEKTLNGQIDAKRKELIKRYKIDEQRKWQIDINSRKVVYQS